MATVTKSSIIISNTFQGGVESVDATVNTYTYTVPASSYAIVNVYTASLGTGGGEACNYSIAQSPSAAAIQASLPVAAAAPVRSIYLGAGEALTLTVTAPGGGTSRMTITGVLFTNS